MGASQRVSRPLTGNLAGSDPDSQLNFWHTLATRPVTSNDEAFHGLLLFQDGQDKASDYAGRVQILRSRKMLPTGFNEPADQAVSRGTLAVAVCRILNMKGGLMMNLTGGSSPRYAVRELQYVEVYPLSSPQQAFSGNEFLGIIGRIEDYQRGTASAMPASMLPSDGQGGSPKGR